MSRVIYFSKSGFRKSIQVILLAIALVSLAPMASASALELSDAKAAGLVGETVSGYLSAVSNAPSPDVANLVKDINSKRKAEYQRIAQESGTTVETVEKLAAKKAIEKTPGGQFFQTADGIWKSVPK